LGLSQKRQQFLRIRKTCEVIISKHAFLDYPARNFSQRELLNLIRKGDGSFRHNRSENAIEGSILFITADDEGYECQLVVLIEKIEIEGEDNQETQITVCSAAR